MVVVTTDDIDKNKKYTENNHISKVKVKKKCLLHTQIHTHTYTYNYRLPEQR